MGWPVKLLEATRNRELTQDVVTVMVTEMTNSVIQAMVMIGIMTIFVKEFYEILGSEKYASERAEMLERVEEIW